MITVKGLSEKLEDLNGYIDTLNYNLDRYALIAEQLIKNGWNQPRDEKVKDEVISLEQCGFLKNFDKLSEEEKYFYAKLQLLRMVAVTISLWEDFPENRKLGDTEISKPSEPVSLVKAPKKAPKKKNNLKKLTSDELRAKLKKCYIVADRTNAFENLSREIADILNCRNYTAIYNAACDVLKNKGRNQFAASAEYAEAVINGSDYFSTDETHEIGSFYTKSGQPYIVYF